MNLNNFSETQIVKNQFQRMDKKNLPELHVSSVMANGIHEFVIYSFQGP